MAMQSERKLAVLIDADNAAAKNLKPIMDEVAKYGVPTIKHAYGDWAKLGGWKDSLLEIGAVPVQQYAYTSPCSCLPPPFAWPLLHSSLPPTCGLHPSRDQIWPLSFCLAAPFQGIKASVSGIWEHR